jgi:hypothetical protein
MLRCSSLQIKRTVVHANTRAGSRSHNDNAEAGFKFQTTSPSLGRKPMELELRFADVLSDSHRSELN